MQFEDCILEITKLQDCYEGEAYETGLLHRASQDDDGSIKNCFNSSKPSKLALCKHSHAFSSLLNPLLLLKYNF